MLLAYRYQPEALAQPAQFEAEILHVVGGLYGNPAALSILWKASDDGGIAALRQR